MRAVHYRIKAPLKLTAVVFSDFHSADRPDQNAAGYIEGILSDTKEVSPDIILAPGDIFNYTNESGVDENFNANGLRLLTGAAGIAPVYFSVGNHEQGMSAANSARLESVGITVLDNCYVRAHGIIIGGFTSGYTMDKSHYGGVQPEPDTSFLDGFSAEDGFRLLLCHHPEYWEKYLAGSGIDLTVSGHAHGGQWGFFGRRGVFAPGQGMFPKYVRGLYSAKRNGKEEILAVSRGMTNTVPVPRFFNPCEIVFLHLTNE